MGLETNLSCNFSSVDFDEDLYFNFVHDYFCMLDDDAMTIQQKMEASKKIRESASEFYCDRSHSSTEVDSSATPTPPDSDSDDQQETVVRQRRA